MKAVGVSLLVATLAVTMFGCSTGPTPEEIRAIVQEETMISEHAIHSMIEMEVKRVVQDIKVEAGPRGVQGPAGPKGPPGSIGPAGPEGPGGPEGSPGSIGPVDRAGPRGLSGSIGPAGPVGRQGPAGPNDGFVKIAGLTWYDAIDLDDLDRCLSLLVDEVDDLVKDWGLSYSFYAPSCNSAVTWK